MSLNCTWFTESQVEITKDLQLVLHKNEARYARAQHSGKVPPEVLLTRLILFMILGCQDLFIRHHQEYICQAFFWTKQRMALTDIDGNIYWGWDKCDVY